jgi:hypothetical protein
LPFVLHALRPLTGPSSLSLIILKLSPPPELPCQCTQSVLSRHLHNTLPTGTIIDFSRSPTSEAFRSLDPPSRAGLKTQLSLSSSPSLCLFSSQSHLNSLVQ